MTALTRYSEALERQMDVLRVVDALRKAGARIPSPMGDPPFTASENQQLAYMGEMLAGAAPYYWSRELCDLLISSAASLPLDAVLHSDQLPARAGFWWFEAPFEFPCPAHENERDYLVALFWWKASVDPAILRSVSERSGELRQGGGSDGVAWVALVGREGFAGGFPAWMDTLPFGTSIHRWIWDRESGEEETPPSDDYDPVYIEMFTRVVVGGLLLINQRIAMTTHHRAERAARRRMERIGWQHEPVIQVVQLRRRETTHEHPNEHEARDWSCRWFVRGHWRQQPCGPHQSERRTVWVTPYVKGPEDKPVKPPRTTVFAVTR